jgi:hypothetical protein
MEWEWLLPSPADLLLNSFLGRLNKRRIQALEKSARSWPKASAHVHATRVRREERPSDSWLCWQPELTYSYVINGEYYSGSYLLPPDSEDEADERARFWRDKDVTVRYDSQEVTYSVFLLEDQSA